MPDTVTNPTPDEPEQPDTNAPEQEPAPNENNDQPQPEVEQPDPPVPTPQPPVEDDKQDEALTNEPAADEIAHGNEVTAKQHEKFKPESE